MLGEDRFLPRLHPYDENILYIEYEKRDVFVHTSEGKMFFPGTFRYWLDYFSKRKCSFEKADRYLAVNAPKIKSWESSPWEVWIYFDEEKTVGCRISNTYFRHLKRSGMLGAVLPT